MRGKNMMFSKFPVAISAIVTAFVLTGGTAQPAAAQSSVTVDYGVLDTLGGAPNVPSVLLGQPAPVYAAPVTPGSAARLSNVPESTDGPRFPVIRNGRFELPRGQMGLRAPSAASSDSLLAPPKPIRKPAPRRTVRKPAPVKAAPKPPAVPKPAPKAPEPPVQIVKKAPLPPPAPAPEPKAGLPPVAPAAAVPTMPDIPKAPDVVRTPQPPAPAPAPVPKAAPKPAEPKVASLPPAAPGPAGEQRIAFAAGSAKLDSGGTATLSGVVAQLNANPALRVQLMAYAAGNGKSASQARRLSLSRALAVRSQLIGSGIKSTRIDVRALGDNAGGGPPDRVDLIVKQR